MLDGGSHLLGIPGGEDVSEVTRGHADVDGGSRRHLVVVHELRIARDVVNDLRHQTAPVDGVGTREGDLVLLGKLRVEGYVAEDGLRARLAIVEVAAYAPDAHVVACLGSHLLELDVGHAAVGIHDADLHAFAVALAVAEALERGLARVAARGDQDEELVVEHTFSAQFRCALREAAGQALQGHILEGAGRAMPQLQDMCVLVKRGDGADGFVVEVRAICARHDAVDGLVGEVDVEALVNRRSALGVRQVG